MQENPTYPTETTHQPHGGTWHAAPPQRPGTDWARVTRNWLIVLALLVLSLSLLTGLVAANQAITIWMQPQYAPFVRLAGAALVAAASLIVVLRLTGARRI